MLEINSILYDEIFRTTQIKANQEKATLPPSPSVPVPKPNQDKKDAAIEKIVTHIDTIAPIMNRKLHFEYNKQLEQIIVKIVEKDTDKVIKQLPPEVLQDLFLRIRKAIGVMIDEII